jgi:hypothetical protein
MQKRRFKRRFLLTMQDFNCVMQPVKNLLLPFTILNILSK